MSLTVIEALERKGSTGGNNIMEAIDNLPLSNDTVKVGIACSALGMTVDDAENKNAGLLTNAINSGKSILVDGFYDINLSEAQAITKDVLFEGITEDAGFNIVTGGNWFEPSGNIKIKMSGIALVNAGESMLVMFRVASENATSVLLEDIRVNGCSFYRTGNGSLRFLDYETVISTPPSDTFGITNIVFDYNSLDNVNTFFFRLIGTPIISAYLAYNRIHNHNHVLYYAAIENTDQYDQEIKESRKLLVIRGNVTINDDDYWCTTSNGNYCCLALSESKVIYVLDNYTEGIHSENNCTITDVYASAEYVYIARNTRKNLASFASNVTGTTVFRCKGIRSYGEYSNNAYVVEDDYADKVGKTDETIKTVFLLEGIGTGTVCITDNYVKVQTLLGMSYSCQNDTLVFDRNIINAKYWGKSAPIYAITASKSKNVFMRDNSISISNIDSGIAFYILSGQGYTNAFAGEQAENIVFTGNTVELSNNNSMPSEPLFYHLSANKILLDNNTFKIDDKADNGFLINGCNAKVLFTIKNQTVERNKPYISYSRKNSQFNSVIDESDIFTIANESLVGEFINSDMDYLSNTSFASIYTLYEYDLYTPNGFITIKFDTYRYTENNVEKIRITKEGTVLYDDGQDASNNVDVVIISDSMCRIIIRVYKQGTVTNKMAKFSASLVSVPAGTRYKEIQKTIKVPNS